MINNNSHLNAPLVDALSGKPVKLTKKEREVMTLITQGQASKQVADVLFISKRTVDFHLANIYAKLQVTNRVQALLRCQRLGLIEIAG